MEKKRKEIRDSQWEESRALVTEGQATMSRMEVKVWVKVIWEVVADDAGRTTELD